MKHLHERGPDEILANLEFHQDAHIEAAEAEARAEASHKAMRAAVYKALRGTGDTVKDSEMGVEANENVQDSAMDLVAKQIAALKCRAAVDRAKLAAELWRSVRADARRV